MRSVWAFSAPRDLRILSGIIRELNRSLYVASDVSLLAQEIFSGSLLFLRKSIVGHAKFCAFLFVRGFENISVDKTKAPGG